MLPPQIMLFCSQQENQQFFEILKQETSVATFPLDDILNKECYSLKPSLLVVWDTSDQEPGIGRLEELRIAYPKLPLFLVVKEPSKEYLRAALKFKVSKLFELPINNAQLRQSILEVAQSSSRPGLIAKARNCFLNFLSLSQSWMASLLHAKNDFQALIPMNNISSTPHPYFHIPQKKLEPENAYDISVQFFGALNIQVRKKPPPSIKGKKNAAVLAYLLYYHNRTTHRDILMDYFWRDISASSARNSLNVAICNLRKSLSKTFPKEEVIVYDNQSYGINPELKIISDTEKFIHYWKKGNAIESSQGLAHALGAFNTAISYYKEEFLSNIRLDNWCEYERDNLKEIYLFILNRLGIYFFSQKQYNACIDISKKMLREDICLEEVHRKLMACYYMVGSHDMALKQYFKCKTAMEKELNLAPSKSTAELFERIQNGKFILV